MSILGKQIRLERIINRNTGRTVIVPMDHGMSIGPIPGLTNVREAIQKVSEGGANAIVEHKGLVKAGHRGRGKDIGLIIHYQYFLHYHFNSPSLKLYYHININFCIMQSFM